MHALADLTHFQHHLNHNLHQALVGIVIAAICGAISFVGFRWARTRSWQDYQDPRGTYAIAGVSGGFAIGAVVALIWMLSALLWVLLVGAVILIVATAVFNG